MTMPNPATSEKPVKSERPPGICLPWDDARRNLAEINGDPELFRRIWNDNDQLAYLYIWYCLLAF